MFRSALKFVVLLLCVAGAARVSAQDVVIGAGSSSGHGWVVIPGPDRDSDAGASDTDSGDGQAQEDPEKGSVWQIIHIPPRSGVGEAGAAPGTARLARDLHIRPDFITADDARLVLCFPPAKGSGARRVLSLTAVPTVVDGVWHFLPSSRLDTLPEIPGSFDVVGLGCVNGTVFSYLSDGSYGVMGADAWERTKDLPGPERAVAPGAAVGVSLSGSGVAFRVDGLLYSVKTQRVGDGTGTQDRVTVEQVTGSDVIELGVEQEKGTLESVVPLVAPRPRVAMYFRSEQEDGTAGYRVVELSLDTGRVWYAGPVQNGSPITEEDFRILVIGMLAVLVAALIVILRPAGDPSVLALPEGLVLAEPGRRLVASTIDFLVVTWLLSLVTKVTLGEALSPAVWLATGPNFMFFIYTMVGGTIYGTFFEWVSGRTPGKWVANCRVVGVAGGAEVEPNGIGLGRCLIRNGVKWLLPPVSMLPLLDNSARHRGDLFAKAAVVVDVEVTPVGGE